VREAETGDDADATRARAVRSVEAQPRPAAPRDDDATRARTPTPVAAQPTPDEGTVLRGPSAPRDSDALLDETVARPRQGTPYPRPERVHADARTTAPPRRSRIGAIVGIAAGVVVAAVVGISIAVSGTLLQAEPDPTDPPSREDAIIAATVPAPAVEAGVRSPDGSTVTFAVSHPAAEDGDRYRWQRADGSGSTEVSEGPAIVVTGVAAGERVCIDVQVQRGSKTSEPATGCTA
jgi:hypothetical protein